MNEGTTGNASGQLHELIAAAHELKSPLTLISHLAATMQDTSMALTPAEQAQAVQRIRLSADRTLRLVQGLTTSYRLASDDQLAFGFELEPINLAQACEEVAHEITPLAQAQYQQLQLRLGARSPLVVANNDLVRSIIFNLIDNALRHNPPQSTVAVSLRSKAEMVRLCVQDNGPGFSPSDLNHLAQTLGREAQPLRGRAGSSGLGLYIASVMASAMGGRLGVGRTSKPGADFHVDLIHSKQVSFL